MPLNQCPCCDATARAHWASESGFNVVRCGECGLLYVDPMPDPESVDSAVRSGFHKLGGLAVNVRSRRVARKVAIYRRRISTMLVDVIDMGRPVTWVDVGCGYGEFMEALQAVLPAGSKVVGVEPMTHKAGAARGRGLEVINDYLKPQQFEADFISNIDVFSHIADYRSFLRIVATNLKPLGEIIIETGNSADLQSRAQAPNEMGLPDHLVFAGRATMDRYFASAGFRVKDVVEERFDTISQMAKNAIKLAIGRPSYVAVPYTSPYRQLTFRAAKF
jgi:SAM-dependent methyltransferase